MTLAVSSWSAPPPRCWTYLLTQQDNWTDVLMFLRKLLILLTMLLQLACKKKPKKTRIYNPTFCSVLAVVLLKLLFRVHSKTKVIFFATLDSVFIATCSILHYSHYTTRGSCRTQDRFPLILSYSFPLPSETIPVAFHVMKNEVR